MKTVINHLVKFDRSIIDRTQDRCSLDLFNIFQLQMAFSPLWFVVAWITAEDGYTMTSAFMVDLIGATETF